MLRSLTIALAVLALVGCGGDATSSPDGRVVAEIDTRQVTAAQVQEYFDAVLAMGADDDGAEDESIAQADLDRIKSRLFDRFLDEEIFLFEAERRGVRVEPWEVEGYLGREPDDTEAAPPDPDGLGYRLARRNLMIQKLRGAVVGAEVQVSEAEVDAYLDRHRREMLPDDQLIVRRLTLSGKKEANDVRREIIEKSMPFARAAEVFGSTPDQRIPAQIELDALPEAMRKAVEKIEPGQISRPVEFDGAYHLLLLEAWPAKSAVDEEQLRERARQELHRVRAASASARLLERLRGELRIGVHAENLPFSYTAE